MWLAGKVLSEMSGNQLSDFRRDNIGFIFQAYNLIPVLTVEENVEYIMLLAGVPKAERHERVIAMLEAVGLKGIARPDTDAAFRRTAAARRHCTGDGL